MTSSEFRDLPEGLTAERLIRTLASTGWVPSGGRPELYERWTLSGTGIEKILIPIDPERPDYTDLLRDAWGSLTRLASRAVEASAALAALNRAPGDEVRFHKEAHTIRGAVAWPDGEDLILSARHALVAAAKASLSRRSYYAQRHGTFAKRFLESVLMGQTQVGSYVVTAYTPVDEIFEERPSATPDTTGARRIAGYRGREITETLTTALLAVQEAAAHYNTSANLNAFEEGVKSGISKELTDAVGGMLRHADATTIHFDWSTEGQQTLALPGAAVAEDRTFTFEASMLPVLERASLRLAAMTTSEYVTAMGWVSLVSRPSRRQAGVIHLRVVRGSSARTLSVRLSNEQYELAATAVTSNALLRVSGRQEKEGNRFWLYVVSDILVIEAPPTNPLPPHAEQLSVEDQDI